jgi:hypothetical protein
LLLIVAQLAIRIVAWLVKLNQIHTILDQSLVLMKSWLKKDNIVTFKMTDFVIGYWLLAASSQ